MTRLFTPDEILSELRRRGEIRDPLTTCLETLLTSPQGFGLVTATPVQRAICRVADGLPLRELADDPEVQEALGCNPALITPSVPQMLGIFSGIRTGKSLLTSALALRASQIVDLSGLGAGETPRVSVLSLTKDLAQAVLDHLRGALEAPALSALLIGDPTADTIMVRHPSGRPIQIQVVAGSRAGAATISRWSAGVILDEAPRMVGAEDGAIVNMDEVVRYSRGRLLPGAQIVALGSPWAPFGPVYRIVRESFGQPSRDLVIFWCPATSLNPVWWTPERCAQLQESDPVAHSTDVLAQFADAVSGMYPQGLLETCTRRGALELSPQPGFHYVAAIDPATRANAWTLIVAAQDRAGRWIVSLARQWRGSQSKPLSPSAVLGEIASILRPYRVSLLLSDQFSGDALKDLASPHGLYLKIVPFTGANKVIWYDAVRTLMQAGRVELPDDPDLIMDLRRVQRRTTQAGVTVDLPRTPDGRHCDYAPALALAIGRRGVEADEPEKPSRHARLDDLPITEQDRAEQDDPYLQAELETAATPWWKRQ